MNSETRNCQNCKKDFTIDPDDFLFYEKMKVPAPTFCPECRAVRRLSWRNERTLYRRECDLCKETIISMYDLRSLKIYCYKCYFSDKWDPTDYGRSCDFSKSFFEQFNKMFLELPKLATQSPGDLVNSPYTNMVGTLKNCYMVVASVGNEDSMYSAHIGQSKNLVDVYQALKSEFCYECFDCDGSYNLIYSIQSNNCIDSWFLFNCRNCTNCFLCSNLVSKSYCINNIQYSKEEYLKIIKELNLDSRKVVDKYLKEFNSIKEKAIRKGIESINAINSSGGYLRNTKDCKQCFDVSNQENSKFVGYGNNSKDVFDAYGVYPNTESCYEVIGSGLNAYNNLFCYIPYNNTYNVSYSTFALPNCNNCFGSTNIRNKQYCILNRQYTKEEYEELVPKIIKHMNDMPYIDSKGRIYKYGEFFPSELSPFAYNETIAQEYFPLTKEQAEDQGYRWKDKEERNYNIDIHTEDIPDSIKDIPDTNILNKVIECSHKGTCNQQCTEAFKIIPEELQFYKRMNLPLPRLCPNCRHYERLSQRNPMKLWHRSCMKEGCTNEFETSYAPERPEIVYCEKCYQQEVY